MTHLQRFPRNSLFSRQAHKRHGAITIFAAILSIVVLSMVSFAVDIGYVLSSKEELQRTADAAALAAVWEYGKQLSIGRDAVSAEYDGRSTAVSYVGSNPVGKLGLDIDANYSNCSNGEVVFGYINDFNDPNATLNTGATSLFNAVRVKVHRDSTRNGNLPLFFAGVFGIDGTGIHTEATAALVRDVKGFEIPNGGGNLDILPYALDLDTWNDWMAGCASDNWTYNADGTIEAGADGYLEVNLFPQGTGSPGNRGTVDIGSCNNSTNDIARQILHGISPADLAYHGGVLQFNSCGYLILNGDTGISAGVKDELADIKGQPRIIPIFSDVSGPGNNADYRIVKWFGIRIMEVKLTGPMNMKRVTIQAAPIVTRGVIPSTVPGTSSYVYSPAVLVR